MSLFFFCEPLQCRYQQLGYWFWCGLGRGQVPDHVVRLTYPAGSQQDRDHIEKCLYFSVLILCHALPCSWESLEVHGDIFLQQVMKYTVLSIYFKKRARIYLQEVQTPLHHGSQTGVLPWWRQKYSSSWHLRIYLNCLSSKLLEKMSSCCISRGHGLGFLYWNGWGTSPSEHTSAFVSDLRIPAPFDVVNCGLGREGSGFCRTLAHLWEELEGKWSNEYTLENLLHSWLLSAAWCPVSKPLWGQLVMGDPKLSVPHTDLFQDTNLGSGLWRCWWCTATGGTSRACA